MIHNYYFIILFKKTHVFSIIGLQNEFSIYKREKNTLKVNFEFLNRFMSF